MKVKCRRKSRMQKRRPYLPFDTKIIRLYNVAQFKLCVLSVWTFAKYVQILFESISFNPFAGWHNRNHHHHDHCDHCLAKCVHVIKTGCRPLSLCAGTLVLADQQPSRNKKLHRGKNRANPGFKAWALVGRLCTGLGPHWAHPVM